MSDCTPDLTQHPNLCPALRWKGQFVMAEGEEPAPAGTDHSFWCGYTQSCIGPDGMNAEPSLCCSPIRACHGTGKCG